MIDCTPSGTDWNVRVRDAVGLVALPDLQLVVHPKIPTEHLIYLFARAGALPRLESQSGSLEAGSSMS